MNLVRMCLSIIKCCREFSKRVLFIGEVRTSRSVSDFDKYVMGRLRQDGETKDGAVFFLNKSDF